MNKHIEVYYTLSYIYAISRYIYTIHIRIHTHYISHYTYTHHVIHIYIDKMTIPKATEILIDIYHVNKASLRKLHRKDYLYKLLEQGKCIYFVYCTIYLYTTHISS